MDGCSQREGGRRGKCTFGHEQVHVSGGACFFLFLSSGFLFDSFSWNCFISKYTEYTVSILCTQYSLNCILLSTPP